MNVLILGCGYTGQRVAERFRARGATVTGTNRSWDLADIRRAVTPGVLVLHSVPPVTNVLEALADAPARVVYLSTTGVYGSAAAVDENTPVEPDTERARLRLEEEQRVTAGPWSWLILRPAAIYGPGRGILWTSRPKVPPGKPAADRKACPTYVSRIHVDDLAAHVEAALLSSITGAYPVADEHPSTPQEIAEFCSQLLNTQVEPRESRSSRRVDGSAIRRLLGITLRYPSYREGLTQQPLPRL